jgi:signal transduction histidine kinase
MASAVPDALSRFEAYHREFLAERLPGYTRLGAGIAFAINTAFVGLDYVSYPENFGFFLGLRLALNTLFLGIYFLGSDRFPRLAIWSICLSLGAVMLAMIFATGGPESRYFAGLILLFVAMGVVLPLSGWEAAGICGAILLPFLASPWLDSAAVDWSVFRIHAVFLISAAAESVASCAYLDHMRFKDFRMRSELREARDHLQELDKAKSRFTANIHHELRTPLALTLAPIEGMLAGEFGAITELQRQYMKTAEANAIRLLKLINDLLDLAKLESQQLELRRSMLDPRRVIEDLVEASRPLAERKGIQLTARCSPELQPIHADPEALERIVINLLGNALKFTESGGRIAAELEPGGEADGVLLRVVDSGSGIPPAQLERIFDRFAQVDTSNTREHEGSGIGLSLCRELVELHGGRIWAESEGEGRGTRMCVWLPRGEAAGGTDECVLETADGRSLSAERGFEALQTEMGQRPHRLSALAGTIDRDRELPPDDRESEQAGASAPEILIADDNADMRSLLRHVLGREFRVRLARNGRQALEAVQERAPDLVLTDVMMPEMSGTDLCRELKGAPETSGIPVILLTSKAERSMKIEGLELGADDYVTKPFHARELRARVRSLVRLRRLQAELEERNRSLKASSLRLESALTELKEAQVQLVQHERLVVVGELAAGVAHEANNPLNFATNAMRGFMSSLDDVEAVAREIIALHAQNAQEAQITLDKLRRLCDERDFEDSVESLRELGGIIGEGLERTSKLVGDLRDFAGRSSAAEETVDLRVGVRSTLQLMSFALREAGITVEVESEPDLPFLYGDTRALNQVLLNLLKNAKDAMKERGGTIHIALSGTDDSVVVRIRDEGHGIPDELRQAIFEPFRTTKSAGQGTGLGLSVSRSILQKHGGSLEVLESSEAGTVFELRLPLPEDD